MRGAIVIPSILALHQPADFHRRCPAKLSTDDDQRVLQQAPGSSVARHVVPGSAVVCVSVDSVPHETYLTVDGQEAVELLLGDRIHCRKSEYSVNLLRLKPNGLFNVLRSKLSWGER